jgi:DNA polymerase III alpha subunit
MFVHLHVHSYYSFLDSTLAIEAIVEAARAAKMPAVALTDTNGLYAAVPFVKACEKAGIRPILGAEIDGFDLGVRSSEFGVRSSKSGAGRGADRVIVLARDRQGYGEISRLITQRHLAPDAALLAPDAALLALPHGRASAFPGEDGKFDSSSIPASRLQLPASLNGWAPAPAVCFSPGPAFEGSLLDALLALSEEHVFILTDSPALLQLLAGRPHVFAELILTRARRGWCRRVYDLAGSLHVPVVATGDVHFERRSDFPLYRLVRAIARKDVPGSEFGVPSSEFGVRSSEGDPPVTEEHFFRLPDDMARAFRQLRAPVRNTMFIAERCGVDLALGRWKFPRVTLPPGETAFSHLAKTAFDAAARRYRPVSPAVTRRLAHELDLIAAGGFCEYFLAVHEIVREARRRGYGVLGRGSAANSIVSYALGLTGVDPLRLDLYFERFLNPERATPPDIDLDFSWKQRDEVVRFIFDHFGHDRVALVSTHVTLGARQAIREVAAALGLAVSQANAFTRPIPGWIIPPIPPARGGATGGDSGERKSMTLADLPVVFPECRDLPIDEEPWRTVVAHAQRLLAFPRHLSIHCGGVLIAPDPITDFTPLQRAAKGTIITQMEMHAVEDLGLIKMDILSNRSLAVFDDCLAAARTWQTEEARRRDGTNG